jgi:hypothetical protein
MSDPLSNACAALAKSNELLIQVTKERDELATLREVTRIRVTAEEPPGDDSRVLMWDPVEEEWIVAYVYNVKWNSLRYTHWAPLPERPAR